MEIIKYFGTAGSAIGERKYAELGRALKTREQVLNLFSCRRGEMV